VRIKGSKKAESGILFISGSTYRRVPVFRYRRACQIFLRTLDAYWREYALRVYAYALLPDHYHLLLWFSPERRVADFLRDFKSLAGRRIVDWLRESEKKRVLARFRIKKTRRRGKDPRFCILQYNSYVKAVQGSRVLRQKLEYIHANPRRDGLTSAPASYPWSSASAYSGRGLSIVKIERLELPYD
jgi:REP element-mobilizing transposase RayT